MGIGLLPGHNTNSAQNVDFHTILFRPFGCIALKHLNYLAFQSFGFKRLVKVISEACCAH
jgi:hypothetical protein